MFGLATLDILIGMAVVYTVLSLVVTTVNELVAQLLNLRGRTLLSGIRTLLDGFATTGAPRATAGPPEPRTTSEGAGSEAVVEARGAARPARGAGESWSDAFYRHPLVEGLRTRSVLVGRPRLPSYIPSHIFAATLLDLIAPADARGPAAFRAVRESVLALPAPLQRPLLLIVDEADGDVGRLRRGIERWFSDAMERVTGMYKRYMQWITITVAIVVTLAANANSTRIWSAFANGPALRAAAVSMATPLLSSRASTGSEPAPPAGDSVRMRLDSLASAVDRIGEAMEVGIPMGWLRGRLGDVTYWRASVMGWLLTVIAISLGAPFWFDVLNKFVMVRSAGRAPEEKPKPPEAMPPARGA